MQYYLITRRELWDRWWMLRRAHVTHGTGFMNTGVYDVQRRYHPEHDQNDEMSEVQTQYARAELEMKAE